MVGWDVPKLWGTSYLPHPSSSPLHLQLLPPPLLKTRTEPDLLWDVNNRLPRKLPVAYTRWSSASTGTCSLGASLLPGPLQPWLWEGTTFIW